MHSVVLASKFPRLGSHVAWRGTEACLLVRLMTLSDLAISESESGLTGTTTVQSKLRNRFPLTSEQRFESVLAADVHHASKNVKIEFWNQMKRTREKVVLVVGACGLDRLLTVPTYPEADAKVRTTSYNEVGGGNAANTATAMGLLTNASFLKEHNIRIKFVGKVGADAVGKQLYDDLEASNVDTSSPLCLRGEPGSTTSFTTIIVSEKEHTRTCFHTVGTCGDIQVSDVLAVDLDLVFENVVHVHSDSRSSAVSLLLAKEAIRRGATVSCDCEKDRQNNELDELIRISNLLFTNSNYLGSYLTRLTTELESEQKVKPLPSLAVKSTPPAYSEDAMCTVVKSLAPSSFFSRWYPQVEREVIVTQ